MKDMNCNRTVGADTNPSLLRSSHDRAENASEVLEVFRRFSRVSEGVLLRVKKPRTLLHLSPEHSSDTDYVNLSFIALKEDDHLLLYQIESSRISNVHYIWQRPYDVASEEYNIANRRVLDTTTFYFLTAQGNEVVKCFFVIGNETLNSLKLFFSMFEIVGDGVGNEQISSTKKTGDL